MPSCGVAEVDGSPLDRNPVNELGVAREAIRAQGAYFLKLLDGCILGRALDSKAKIGGGADPVDEKHR